VLRRPLPAFAVSAVGMSAVGVAWQAIRSLRPPTAVWWWAWRPPPIRCRARPGAVLLNRPLRTVTARHLVAANASANLKELMARMGHDSERAALIYQHEARGADQRITDAIDFHVQAERDQGDDGMAGALVPAG
jgi:hypothetical protein